MRRDVVDRINPYAVARNTATYQAYQAYMRRAHQAGQPFLTLALLVGVLIPSTAPFAVRLLLHRTPVNVWFVVAAYAAPVFLGGLFMVLAAAKTLRFRREHPIPEEWRQIPRSAWPSASRGRTPAP